MQAHVQDEVLRVQVTDDGAGGAVMAPGSGLQGLADRIGRSRADQEACGEYHDQRFHCLSATGVIVASLLVIARRQDEHRCLRAGGAQAAQHLEAVHLRQANIQDDKIEALVGRGVHRVLAARRHVDRVTLGLEDALQSGSKRLIVLYDEQAHGGLVGGLGLAPGLCVGETQAMAQATHGSAPDIAGRNIANPSAMIISGQMLLAWLGWDAMTLHHGYQDTTQNLGIPVGLLMGGVRIIDQILLGQLKNDPKNAGKPEDVLNKIIEGRLPWTPNRITNSINQDDLYVDLAAVLRVPLYLKCEGFNFAGSMQWVSVLGHAEDHVVEPDSCAMLLEKVASTDVREVVLHDSYHVATLDNDAETIFEGSLDFVRRLAKAAS